mmetsp:Transcript_27269/g.63288  ORF Transcript_27269/g.63288 Transcript_27269/m.63288 type:complete len:175 (+) Transcript_27269:222-746(+)
MAEGPRSRSDMGFYGRGAPPKTPSSAMWESLGMSKRPSQKELLAATPMERREYTMQQGAHMHLHKHCLSPDGNLRVMYGTGVGLGRTGSSLPFGPGKATFSMKEFRAMMQQHKNHQASASMDSESSDKSSSTRAVEHAQAAAGDTSPTAQSRGLSRTSSGASDAPGAGGGGGGE